MTHSPVQREIMMSKLLASLGLAAVGLLAFSAVACNSGGGGEDNSTREISAEELSRMVLELGLFGPEYAAFAPEEPTGPLTIDQTAEEEDDPAAEKIDLEQFGWVAAHKAAFQTPQLTEGQVGFVGSMVYVFGGKDGAAGYMDDSLSEVQGMVGQNGIEKVDISELDLSDEGAAMVIEGQGTREDGSKVPFSVWSVAFRHGRLVNLVQVSAYGVSDLEKKRLESKVESLAAVMHDRTATVLATGGDAAAAAP
jgi:hypothetical protein